MHFGKEAYWFRVAYQVIKERKKKGGHIRILKTEYRAEQYNRVGYFVAMMGLLVFV